MMRGSAEHNLQKLSIRSSPLPTAQRKTNKHTVYGVMREGNLLFVISPVVMQPALNHEQQHYFHGAAMLCMLSFFYICLTVQPLPRSIASLFCHFVSSLFTHTGLSMSVPMTTSPLLSPTLSLTFSSLLCYKRRRGQRKASVASYTSVPTQGHVDSFTSLLMSWELKYQMNYISSQLEHLG